MVFLNHTESACLPMRRSASEFFDFPHEAWVLGCQIQQTARFPLFVLSPKLLSSKVYRINLSVQFGGYFLNFRFACGDENYVNLLKFSICYAHDCSYIHIATSISPLFFSIPIRFSKLIQSIILLHSYFSQLAVVFHRLHRFGLFLSLFVGKLINYIS